MKYVTCVYEDDLTAALMRRLLREFSDSITIKSEIPARGFGKIKRDILKYNVAARYMPFFIVTDLDLKACAPTLISEWFGNNIMSGKLLFRVAVREADAWVLADRHGIAKTLGVSPDIIPLEPEQISDPKNMLMQCARKSRFREIRENFPPRDVYAHQGPLYNPLLTKFVSDSWNLQDAMNHADSLQRAYTALKRFAEE